jgi:DNA (cytosine-5)-methyltransferase 1
MKSSPTYIDLYAGAGGLSEGFLRTGFKPIAHVELDEAACYTLKTRTAYHYLKSVNEYDTYISYLKGEISRNDLYSSIPQELLDVIINLSIGSEYNNAIHKRIKNQLFNNEVDLIIGGPPCQAYSLVGRARAADRMIGDPRNYLYKHYAKYLELYQPKMFVFENVLGLKSASKGLYLSNMENLFLKKGYLLKLFIVAANNFGVLQKRKRIIIIGWKKNLTITIPDLETIKNNFEYNVNSIFDDLPSLQPGQGTDKYIEYGTKSNKYLNLTNIRNGLNVLTQHVARPHTEQDREIYRIAVEKWNVNKERLNYNHLPSRLKTHENRNSFFDRFKVVAANELYSQTVMAHISKDGHYYIHPDIKQNRSITVREAARLQSFPDDYYFEGIKEGSNRTAAFKQIGNAVPPLLSQKIAELIKSQLLTY